MPEIDNAALVALATATGSLADKADSLRNWNFKLIAGTVDDPDSFDEDGLPASDPEHGPLGYYPLLDGSGGTVYFPCWARWAFIAGGTVAEFAAEAEAAAVAAAASATAADGSADAAAASAIAAAGSASGASGSATTATTKAGEASASATAAAASASAASGSATTATTKAGEASASATAAAGSATAAAGSATAASGSATSAAASAAAATAAASGTALVASISLTSPLLIGGTGAASTLTIQSTSGTGTSDAIIFKTGSQVERMRITTAGLVGVGGVPSYDFDVVKASAGQIEVASRNSSTGAAVGARFRASTGTASAFITWGINDGSGTPYAVEASGSAVVEKYADYAAHSWRSQGAVTMMRLTAAGLGIGVTASNARLEVAGAYGTTAISIGIASQPVFQSAVTSGGIVVYAGGRVAPGATMAHLRYVYAEEVGVSGATVTTQSGFIAGALTGATNNNAFFASDASAVTTGKLAHGFYTNMAIATGGGTTYAFRAAGTAQSYFGGNVGIGNASASAITALFGPTLSVGNTSQSGTVAVPGGYMFSNSYDLKFSSGNGAAADGAFVFSGAFTGAQKAKIHASGGVSINNNTDPGAGNLSVTGRISASVSIRKPSYTVATVPSASAEGAGAEIYVTNESGGATGAESDGTNWRRYADRAIIS